MRSQDQTRAMAECVLDRGQSFPDARVVHDASILQGDVEVHTHENSMVIEWKITDGKLRHSIQPSVNVKETGALHLGKDGLRFLRRPLQTFRAEIIDQISNARRVSPLVVVPRDYFDAGAADHQSHGRIHDGRARASAT